MKQIILTAAVAAIALFSCKKNNHDNGNNAVVYGKKVTVRNGPVLEGLPAHETEFFIELPEKTQQVTPYKHVSMDWTPAGHAPQPIYDKPHFDIHFFMVSRDEQNAISASSPDLQKLPDSTFLPEFYFPEPGGLDKMGKHWADATSPELSLVNPAPFTSTMIYGTYNAKVVFLEPMITRAFLQSQPDTIMNIRQPHSFAVSSNYPQKYKIRVDASSGKIFITLNDFKFREKHQPGH